MAGRQSRRERRGRGGEEQERLGHPGPDPLHPGQPSREPGVEASSPRPQDDRLRDEEDLREEEL
ncbi:hypothetical protein [Streptomyces sp. NPDC002990]